METAPIRMSPTGQGLCRSPFGPRRPVPEMVELFQRTTPREPREVKTER